jgi:hypothetical protein
MHFLLKIRLFAYIFVGVAKATHFVYRLFLFYFMADKIAMFLEDLGPAVLFSRRHIFFGFKPSPKFSDLYSFILVCIHLFEPPNQFIILLIPNNRHRIQ